MVWVSLLDLISLAGIEIFTLIFAPISSKIRSERQCMSQKDKNNPQLAAESISTFLFWQKLALKNELRANALFQLLPASKELLEVPRILLSKQTLTGKGES
jgi:hypothetical protein